MFLVKPRVVIQGWYGNGNLGDEIILECMLSQIRNQFPNATFVVVSDNPTAVRRDHGVASIRRGRGRIQRFRRVFALMRADLFILGGGGLLKQPGADELSVLTWAGPLDLAQEIGVPTMTYAIGISDGLSPRAMRALGRILNGTNEVLVRDEGSAYILRTAGVSKVRPTADPSLLLPELHQYAKSSLSNMHPRVSVFVNNWYPNKNASDQQKWERFQRSVAASLDFLIESRSASIKFVPMRIEDPGDDDRITAHDLQELMTHGETVEIAERVPSSQELLDLVAGSDLVIGMRLHSIITAAALGVPALALDYDSKVRRFSDAIGASDWVVGMDEPTPNAIESLEAKALAGGYPTDQVCAKVNELRALARENAMTAAELIREPSRKNRLVPRMARALFAVVKRLVGRSGDE
ncbi:MAG: polysaccharide pyruvyl transferase family protein [Thaumarchaeota archaeon]|nr:polysaccharide pyruvyl transferase family protein [Nitrososphaerota archaeon]